MRSQDGSTSKPSAAPRLVPNLLHPQTDIHITLWYNVCQIYIINIRTWIWLSADYSRRPRVSSSPDSPPPPPYFSSSSKVLMIVIEPRFSIDSTVERQSIGGKTAERNYFISPTWPTWGDQISCLVVHIPFPGNRRRMGMRNDGRLT